MSEDAELRASLDLFAISRLQASYGDVVTRRAWHELEELFVPGCPLRLDLRDGRTIEHTGAEAIGRFISGAIERFEFFEFAVLNAVAELHGDDTATGRMYICELRQDQADHQWSNAFGLYQDQLRKVDGRWRFAERHYSSLARTAADGRGFDVFPMP